MSVRVVLFGLCWIGLGVLSVAAVDKPPGIVVRLKPSALNFASDHAAKYYLARYISWSMSESLNDMDHAELCTVGKCSLQNAVIKHYVAPVSNVTFVPGFGIEFKLNGAELNLNFDVKLSGTVVDEHLEGRASVRLSNLSFVAEIALDRGYDDSLLITLTKCSADFRSIESDVVITPGSGNSNISQGFYDRNKTEINGYLQDTVNETVSTALCNLADSVSRAIPDGLRIYNYLLNSSRIHFDGTLARELILKSDHIEAAFRAEFRTDEPDMNGSSVQPPSFDLPPEDSNMIAVYFSDYVVNTLGEVLFKKGWLSQTFSADIFSYRYGLPYLYKNYRDLFDTACDGTFCFKTIFPNISDDYPNATVKFKVRATRPPTMTFSRGAQTYLFALDLDIVVPGTAAESEIRLATLSMSISHGSDVSFLTFSDRVVFVATSPNITITDERSPAEFVSYAPRLNFVLKTFMNSLFIPWCNIYGAIGIPLDLMEDIRFVNLDLGFERGVFRFGTDMVYDLTRKDDEDWWRSNYVW